MAEGVSASMSLVLRMVGDAIGLDSQNRRKEAYCQYLSCCIYISQILKDNAWDKDLQTVYNKDVAKLFKLIQQCQERALNIISSESPSLQDSPPASPGFPPAHPSQTLTPPLGIVRKSSDPLPPRPGLGHTRTPSDPPYPGLSTTPPQYQGKPLKLPSPPSSPRSRVPGQSMTNLSKPQTDRRINAGLHFRLSRDAVDKNLSTMRKMSENMLIAKAREEAIRKKFWERQQRLQIEANRRFASDVAASEEEQQQRLLYTKILQYEQDMVWPQQLRHQLKHSPEDTALINNIINKIFSSKDHPLKQYLLQYQYHIYKKLLPLLKDVEFPNEKQMKNKGNSLDSSQTFSKTDDQVDSGSTTHRASDDLESKNTSNQQSSDGAVGKYIIERDDDESGGSNVGLLQDEENKMDKDGRRDDTDASSVTIDANTQNISQNYQNNIEVIGISQSNRGQEMDETNQSDMSNMDEVIEKRSSDSDEIQVELGLKDEVEESSDSGKSEEQCTEDQFSDGAVLKDQDIVSIVNNILEEIITQIVEEESTGTSANPNDDTNGDTNHLELKSVNDDDSEVDSIGKDDSTSKLCADKKTRLSKIESFDLESEFLSLEDDMFESESGGEEDEEKPDTIEHSSDCLADQSTEPAAVPSLRIPSNAEENNEKEEVSEKKEEKEEKPEVQENTSNSRDTDTGDNDENKGTPATLDLEDTRRQLNEIFIDMRFFLEKLKGFIILAYEELATPTGHDQCYAAVEDPFFQPLWPLLLGVLRRVNFDKEISLGSVMTKRVHITPADVGVIDRLCLSDKECLEATGNKYPYQLAVEQLHKVSTHCCPLEKIECIVRASRGICQCVEDYWESKGKPKHCPETSIGCDDLLPIFSYVIIKSGMAQLVSETIAMEEFIPEGYLMGEEGYCLTTLQTALAYLVTLY